MELLFTPHKPGYKFLPDHRLTIQYRKVELSISLQNPLVDLHGIQAGPYQVGAGEVILQYTGRWYGLI